MKPSQIVLAHPPLVNTMQRAEIEHAAAMYVAACHHHGDEWKPLSLMQIGDAVQALLQEGAEPWRSLKTNPFFRPDLRGFVDSDYGTGDELGIELTPLGLEAIRFWAE